MKIIHPTFTILTVLLLLNITQVFSQVVTNGSFTNATGNSVTPAGWANTPGNNPGPAVDPFPSVDVLGVGFTSYTGASVVAATPSPDGGTWVGLSSIQNMENEAIQQVVTGLVIGQTYQASLWVANFGGPGFDDAGTITIYANNVGVVTSPVLNLVANVWTQITGNFVATAANMTIQIDAFHSTGPAGSGYYSVDGLTIIPLCVAAGIPNLSLTNICLDQQTYDLSTITSDNIPAGTNLTWHNGIPVSNATQLAVINNVPLGNYYAAFFDAVNNCYGQPQLVELKANPVASFTALNVCEGNNVNFQNTSTVPAPNVLTNWDWVFGDNAISAVENPTHLFASENDYSNQLTVTASNGCTNVVTNTVSVFPLPVISFNSVNVCEENTSVFNNTSTISSLNTPNSITSWLWTFGDGNTASTQNANNVYLTEGNYNVTLQGTSNNGCVSNLQQPVTVYPKPVANYSVDDVCVNLATSFTDLSTINGGGIISNWDWTFGDLATSAVQNPTHIYGAENIYNTRLIVTTTDGCKDTLSAQATVYPRPIVDFTATNVCQEFSNQFTANTTISNLHTANTIATWNYIFDDGSNSNLQNVSHLYLNDGVYNVYLVATSNNGCADSIQKPVNVYPKPNAVISGINLSGCSPVCPSLTSVSTVNAPSTIAQMNWEYSDGAVANGINSIRCLDNNSDQTEFYGVTLFVETNNGCKDTAINLNYIQVYHNPIADFSFSPTAPDIQNNIIEFTNTSLNANTYQWNISNGQFSTLTNPKVELSDGPGYYLAQLTAFTTQGCFDTISKQIFIKDVVTYWIPNTFTPDGNEYNNTWKPIVYSGIDESSIHFMVFNRWGEMVWESFDQNQGWDGSYAGNLAQKGTYSWVFEYKVNGVDERKKDVGHLNIIR